MYKYNAISTQSKITVATVKEANIVLQTAKENVYPESFYRLPMQSKLTIDAVDSLEHEADALTIADRVMLMPAKVSEIKPLTGLIGRSVLNIRSSPNTTTSIVGSYFQNSTISVLCQTTGSNVNGSNEWYQTDRGFVSGRYILMSGLSVPSMC